MKMLKNTLDNVIKWVFSFACVPSSHNVLWKSVVLSCLQTNKQKQTNKQTNQWTGVKLNFLGCRNKEQILQNTGTDQRLRPGSKNLSDQDP